MRRLLSTEKLSDTFDVTAAKFCDEVADKAKKLNLRIFIVAVNDSTGSGSSSTVSPKIGDPKDAVANARKAHEEWEKRNGINPHHERNN